jgi:hypothetical protein
MGLLVRGTDMGQLVFLPKWGLFTCPFVLGRLVV